MKNSGFAALLLLALLSTPATAQVPCYGQITDRNNDVLKLHDGCYFSAIDGKWVCTDGFPACHLGQAVVISSGGGKPGINYHEREKILKKLDLGAKDLFLRQDLSKNASVPSGN